MPGRCRSTWSWAGSRRCGDASRRRRSEERFAGGGRLAAGSADRLSARRAVLADRLDLDLLVRAVPPFLALPGVHVDVPLEDSALVNHQIRLLESDLSQHPPLRMDLEPLAH